MRSTLCAAALLLLYASPVRSQERDTGEMRVWFALAPLPGDPQDDPAYPVYRKGYACVMEERWAEARKMFEEIQRRYPRSPFADDASYWYAYTLAQTDRRKAIEAYQRFLERYPRSRYFEDASADYAALQSAWSAEVRIDSTAGLRTLQGHLRILQEHGLRPLEFTVQRMNRSLRFRISTGGVILNDPFPSAWAALDDDLRRRLESLAARGEFRGDEEAFRTLEAMARDPRKPPPLRSVAVRSIARISRFDPLPVLVEVARTDTSWSVQETAILSIGQAPVAPDQAIESLAGLYQQLPDPTDQRRLAVIDAAATLGTPRALMFLAQVARTAPDTVLQTVAIDNIAAAGRDSRRIVELLIDLFQAIPKERRSARATALYGVAEMGTDRAVDFLVQVARGDQDEMLRRDALIYLGTIGGPRARNALHELLRTP